LKYLTDRGHLEVQAENKDDNGKTLKLQRGILCIGLIFLGSEGVAGS
jgi:hypothetical protein